MWTPVSPLPPAVEPPHDAAVRTVTRLSPTRMTIRFFMVFVSPVTFMLMKNAVLYRSFTSRFAGGYSILPRLPARGSLPPRDSHKRKATQWQHLDSSV